MATDGSQSLCDGLHVLYVSCALSSAGFPARGFGLGVGKLNGALVKHSNIRIEVGGIPKVLSFVVL